jgi:hypothetical protein
MSVNLSGGDVIVAKKFLYGADIRSSFQEVCGKAVPQYMWGHPFGDSRPSRCDSDRPLQTDFMDVMPLHSSRSRVHGQPIGREDPPPDPLFARVGLFVLHGIR